MPPKLILHIEDDEDDRLMVQEVITSLGDAYLLRQVNNGVEAMSFLGQAKAFKDLPSLIIVDINMPLMDGREVVFHISKDPVLSKIPVVVFTTSSSPIDREFCKKYGVVLMIKPVRLNQFNETVHKVLELCKRSDSE